MDVTWANSQNMTHIPRFAPLVNIEQCAYYGFGTGTFSLFAGAASHNLGVITRVNDSVKYKNRVYSTGLLGGFRIGFNKGAIFAGGGADIPVQYKSKKFVNGVKMGKEIGYFSKEANWILPHVFVGFDASFLEVKAQFYPTNFWGKKAPDFVNGSTQLLKISVGLNRIWFEDLLKDKAKKDDKEPEEEDKTKPRRYPWDKNKENET